VQTPIVKEAKNAPRHSGKGKAEGYEVERLEDGERILMQHSHPGGYKLEKTRPQHENENARRTIRDRRVEIRRIRKEESPNTGS